jgi:outer membrane protein assembly factor BamB
MKILRVGLTAFTSLVVFCTLIFAGQAAPLSFISVRQATPNAPFLSQFVYFPLIRSSGAQPTPTPTPTPPPGSTDDWTQQAHDALHSSYTPQVVPTPWHWKWAWNGPNAQGGVSSGKISLPRNSQPVTGGGRVYISAGANGVYALDNANGTEVWNRNPGGSINSTPAYDPASDSLFVVSTNGQLYRLNAATGQTTGNYDGKATSTLPLPPALYGGRVYFGMGTHVYAIQKDTLLAAWAYDAGSTIDAPPAFSPATGLVIASSDDLYIHAIHDSNGTRAWRVKPTSLSPGEPGDNLANAQVTYGWPVIADSHGLVLIKLRLNWQTLWTWSPWPATNAQMRSNLTSRPDQQTLFALRLSNGSDAFVTDVGNGGFGDGGYLAMGPQPVIKHFTDGTEVAYVVMRGSGCINTPCDGRYDSHFGEMELDSTTVPGFQAGDVRFIQNTFFPTDEQPSLTMAGNDIFGGHWMFGIANQIIDRSASKGASSSNPITTTNLPHIVTSASNCAFSANHYCPNGLIQNGDARSLPAGFYIYYNQGQVYNQYWRGSATWIVSGKTIYFASNDGALIAFETGAPAQAAQTVTPGPLLNQHSTSSAMLENPISYTQASQYAGSVAQVEGEFKYEFNNGKEVLLGFQYPHQNAFKALILADDWKNFNVPPDKMYAVGQVVRVQGLIEWYQGDPVIYVHRPEQIQVLK